MADLQAQLSTLKQKVLEMEAQQQDLSHPDVSEWTLKYSLREYKIPYESSRGARQDIESYIKGALCFPSCLKQTTSSDCEEYAVNAVRSQTKIFYNAATMGMGKTRLHNELCRGVMKIDCGDNVTTKFVRFTYNENVRYENDGTGLTFIKQLLNYHGLAKVEADKTRTLEAGFDIFIKKLSENNAFADRTTKVLCVCFDELHQGHYDASIQSCLVKDLMSYQDETLANNEGVRVLFLFSSLTKGMFREMTTSSGRSPVNTPGRVPILDPETIKKLLFEYFPDVKRLIEAKNRFVEQLVDLACDIPRAAFDGLPTALEKFAEGGEGEKGLILHELMGYTQLVKYDTLLKVPNVAEFLAHGKVRTDAERLAQAGLASVTEGGVRIFPLVLRAWASHYASIGDQTNLPWYVHKAYDADSVVQEGSEVLAEKVLQNIEAAKLFSYKMLKTPFCLNEFYRGGKSSGLTLDLHTSAFQDIRVVPPGKKINIDDHLKAGYIVVLPRGEKAIEHLVPFQRTDNEFAVGGVQVKMIKDRPKKTLTDLATNVKKHPAMKGPGERFPVLCTTYPRAFTWETYGVAFNRSGLETFTREFGPLRLIS